MNPQKRKILSWSLGVSAALLLLVGAYLFLDTLAPSISFINPVKQIDVGKLGDPTPADQRLIIPKIGINIPYRTGVDEHSMLGGSWWRYPERGNPVSGGNMILAAHRFDLGINPGETSARSPFYYIDKINPGDKVYVDYKAKRYTYTVTKRYSVLPSAVEIEDPSATPKLTLYTCQLQPTNGRVVVEAVPDKQFKV